MGNEQDATIELTLDERHARMLEDLAKAGEKSEEKALCDMISDFLKEGSYPP